jgi:hypothetical protein
MGSLLDTLLSGTHGRNTTLRRMPFCHTTPKCVLLSLLLSGVLKTRYCTLFNESLIYLFYGRPAYIKTSRKKENETIFFPTTLIFKPDCPVKIKSVFPFDTGGFESFMREELLPGSYLLTDFDLGNNFDEATQWIQEIFGSNENYCYGKANREYRNGLHAPRMNDYFRLLNSSGEINADDRKYSFEVQVVSDIIISGSVEAVAVPTPALSDKLKEIISNEWHAEVVDYSPTAGADMNCLKGSIITEVFRYFGEKEYI